MEKIKAQNMNEIIASNSPESKNLYAKSCFGEPVEDRMQYILKEALFLVEKNKMELFSKNKKMAKKEIVEKFSRIDKKFLVKYAVYKDLRERGYVVKTALKFGADFRVYEKGKRPGKAHAKWVLFVDHEAKKTSWHEFSAKNRVAHSTKKNLLLAIVDEEGDISYYEVRWIKP